MSAASLRGRRGHGHGRVTVGSVVREPRVFEFHAYKPRSQSFRFLGHSHAVENDKCVVSAAGGLSRGRRAVCSALADHFMSHTHSGRCVRRLHITGGPPGVLIVSASIKTHLRALSRMCPPQAPHAPLAARVCTSRGLVAAQDGRLCLIEDLSREGVHVGVT